jgi:hypothetical protein
MNGGGGRPNGGRARSVAGARRADDEADDDVARRIPAEDPLAV